MGYALAAGSSVDHHAAGRHQPPRGHLDAEDMGLRCQLDPLAPSTCRAGRGRALEGSGQLTTPYAASLNSANRPLGWRGVPRPLSLEPVFGLELLLVVVLLRVEDIAVALDSAD